MFLLVAQSGSESALLYRFALLLLLFSLAAVSSLVVLVGLIFIHFNICILLTLARLLVDHGH
jgi:hypothetical protein